MSSPKRQKLSIAKLRAQRAVEAAKQKAKDLELDNQAAAKEGMSLVQYRLQRWVYDLLDEVDFTGDVTKEVEADDVSLDEDRRRVTFFFKDGSQYYMDTRIHKAADDDKVPIPEEWKEEEEEESD
jgi:predicted RNA-binding protein Jag